MCIPIVFTLIHLLWVDIYNENEGSGGHFEKNGCQETQATINTVVLLACLVSIVCVSIPVKFLYHCLQDNIEYNNANNGSDFEIQNGGQTNITALDSVVKIKSI